jgi:hypothetical protein
MRIHPVTAELSHADGRTDMTKLIVAYTIIVPTKCTNLLKAQDITICTFFVFVFLAPTCFSPRGLKRVGAKNTKTKKYKL